MKKHLTISKLMMLIVMAVLPFSIYAQEGKTQTKPVEKYWYIQADGGLSIFHGDLANYNGGIWDDFDHFKMLPQNFTKNWNAHLGIGYQFGKVVGLNFKGGYGLLSGHKHLINNKHPEYGKQALGFINGPDGTFFDLGFEGTSYIEGNLNLTFNLFNMFNYNPRRIVNLVPHIGIGGIYYKAGSVYHLDSNENFETPALANASDKREFGLEVPAGMEITFNLAPKFDIFLDYTYLFTNTDNLDQVRKKEYTNAASFTEEDLSVNKMDMYSQLNLGLRYKFNEPCDIEKMARESKEITYRVNPNPLVEENGKVCFDVIVTIPEEYFEKKAVMNLKPYLAYNGGQIELPEPIIFIGEKVKTNDSYDFRVNYKEGGEFTKHYCMPYQEEMASCELIADPMFYVYDGNIYPTQDEIVSNTSFAQGVTEKLADGVTVTTKPIEPDPEPEPTPEPEPEPEPDFIYYYAKDRSEIRNIKTTKVARQILEERIKSGEEIKGFRIEGWASPEGELEHNKDLANDRSKTAMADIKDQLRRKLRKNVDNYTFEVNGNGPDWQTFEQLVENSDLKDKDAILSQIRNSSNKERAIKDLINVYPVLEDQILPLIRRSEVYIIK